ncbi:MAG: tRNA 2-selenouridine synthase [candidate division TM6 bacterium GW2011_GWE2_42_60]|nr:MAG: tRNA 2-selenouridine synthase [candidate division TM6 bacterium GW2011_GWE2_42_60]HBY05838.1 tRNA 2-selenouridine(34) synthase MnmH [Candidatus Dependentiae bacterium]
MIHQTTVTEFLKKRLQCPVFDVRSPAEYAHAHIPSAFNIPLFSDEERAIVGTIYKQKGREDAIRAGLEIIGPHMTRLVDSVKAITDQKELIFYCWRGGMRSRSVAMLLDFAGYKVHLLTGGYKAFKAFIRAESMQPRRFVMLGGKTGSGKTAILSALAAQGEQVIDLEGIAHHKGSGFGALGQEKQQSQEQFIIDILLPLAYFSQEKPVWLEHEGRRLGDVNIPEELWVHMEQAPLLLTDLPREYRAKRLLQEYGQFSQNEILACVQLLEKRLGGADTKQVSAAIQNNDTQTALTILMQHYDNSYSFNKKNKIDNTIIPITLTGTSPEEHAHEIRIFFSNNQVFKKSGSL